MSGRFALYWLALYRRRRMLLALTLGMVAFETLIIVIARTIPPQELFIGSIRQPPSVFRAFSGSGGEVSLASYPGLLGAGLVHPFWIAMQLTVVGSLGAAAVAADVEAGTIELLMVRPISRARLLTERTAALITGVVLLTAAAVAAIAVGVAATPRLHEAVPLRGVAAAGVLGLGLTLCSARCGRLRAELHRAGVGHRLVPSLRQPVSLLHARRRAGQRHGAGWLPGAAAGRRADRDHRGGVAARAQGPRAIAAGRAAPACRIPSSNSWARSALTPRSSHSFWWRDSFG